VLVHKRSFYFEEEPFVEVALDHGGAFTFMCRLESRDEAALAEPGGADWRSRLAEQRGIRVRSEFRSVKRELCR
jgi:hypothetical protein